MTRKQNRPFERSVVQRPKVDREKLRKAMDAASEKTGAFMPERVTRPNLIRHKTEDDKKPLSPEDKNR